mmetsp:Transcript_52413/g.131772  ORF Transcript_52413/g.131772 Transcript_52413/m.131772 type:complete len:556 (+) Transcript_52413:335-2002(+)
MPTAADVLMSEYQNPSDDDEVDVVESEEDEEEYPLDKVIVLHPSSYYLKLGLAISQEPTLFRHVIAHKKKLGSGQTESKEQKEEVGMKEEPSEQSDSNEWSSFNHGFLRTKLATLLTSILGGPKGKRGSKAPNNANPITYITEKLARSEESIDTTMETGPSFVAGEEAFAFADTGKYNLHCPVKQGKFAVDESHSMSLVSDELEKIWEAAISQKLGISRKDLPSYRAVLVIPDNCPRRELKVYVSLVLSRLGFESLMLCQESIASTFANGLATACVVDVGLERSHVVCVEDGLLIPDSRVELDYGSRAIDLALLSLLESNPTPFPLKQPTPSRHLLEAISSLKEQQTHLNLDARNQSAQCELVVPDGRNMKKLSFLLSQDLVLGPLVLFAPIPQLSTPAPAFPPFYTHDPEDLAEDVVETQAKKQEADAQPNDSANSNENVKFTPLDRAVVDSIQSVCRPEVASKMFSKVIFVGGTASLQNLAEFLEGCLQKYMVPGAEDAEVISKNRGGSVAHLSWVGGSLFIRLATARNMWLHASHWRDHGMASLREKIAFFV